MVFIDEGVFQSVPSREQMHHSKPHSRNQLLAGKFMRVGGEKCVSVEIEREGEGTEGRMEGEGWREREKGVLRNLTLGCGA